jgi:hypothetical protein
MTRSASSAPGLGTTARPILDDERVELGRAVGVFGRGDADRHDGPIAVFVSPTPMARGDRPIGSGRLENRGEIGPDGSQLIADPSLPTVAPQRGHTQHLSDATCSSASSKSRKVGSFVDSSSEEKGDTSGASDVSSPFVSIAGNSQRGSERRE